MGSTVSSALAHARQPHVGGLVLGIVLMLSMSPVWAQDEYRFERLWPVLQQPWYFSSVWEGIGVTGDFVYAASARGIVKMTREGRVVTEFNASPHSSVPFALTARDGRIVAVHVGSNNPFQTVFWVRHYGENGETLSEFGIFETERLLQSTLALDSHGNAYLWFEGDLGDVALVRKYSPTGDLLAEWGGVGNGPGEFAGGQGRASLIVVDRDDTVFVLDRGNGRVQVFNSNGTYLREWAVENSPFALGVTFDGRIVVSHIFNDFTIHTGQGAVVGTAECLRTRCNTAVMAFDSLGFGYMRDQELAAVFKTDSEVRELTRWAAADSRDGFLVTPAEIDLGPDGLLYVANPGAGDDSDISVYAPNGQFVEKFAVGDEARHISVTSSGEVFATSVSRLHRYSPQREHLFQIEILAGSGSIQDMEMDSAGNLYLLVYALTENGDFLAIDIHKYSPDGDLIAIWPQDINDAAIALAIRPGDEVYVFEDPTGGQVLDTEGDSLRSFEGGVVFDAVFASKDVLLLARGDQQVHIANANGETQSIIGVTGVQPLQFSTAAGIVAAPDGTLYVTDRDLARVQKLVPAAIGMNNRAIVLAGGGPFPGNDLWDATQLNASFAYRSLSFQGFVKEDIYYLSADTDLDLDGNGLADDVDADANNANFENAITNWGGDGDNLLIYLVDHGGGDSFRMSGTETLGANKLGGWIDEAQAQLQANCAALGKGDDCGRVTVVYDACRSGSFLNALSGPNRVIMTSAKGSQSAYFASQGSLSFSNHFWTHVFNGLDLEDAFSLAQQQTETALPDLQNPQVDADGDGTANEGQDFSALSGRFIGNGTSVFGEAPEIGSVSPDVILEDGNSALVWADMVFDEEQIARVWAVMRPPGFVTTDPDNPVSELPSFDLLPAGGKLYQGVYNQFSTTGTYQLAIYARDNIGNASVPVLTTVSVESPLARRAIIVAGGETTDALWPAIERNADVAYDALVEQGYSDDEIEYLSATATAGVDGTPSITNLEFALTKFATIETQDLMLYLVGDMEGGALRLNSDETVSAAQLDGWLDGVQTTKAIPGVIVVLIEGPRSGAFLPDMAPPGGADRILVASTNGASGAAFFEDGEITFSKYFWSRVLNGSTVGNAFDYARDAIQFTNTASAQQTPQLDDNGNGVANQLNDGQLAKFYGIGSGILLAGDDPIIGSASAPQVLDGDTSALLFAEDVTTTGNIDRVFAVITPPGFQQTGGVVNTLPTVDLNPVGNKANRYQANYNGFGVQGVYQISMHAVDTDGAVSFPAVTTVTQTMGELPITLPASIAGSWFPAGHSGEGFLFEVIAPGIAVVYWFTYDGEGNQLWMFGVGTIVENRIEVAELLEASGGVFGPDFDPDAISFKTVGNAIFTFSSCDAGIVEFTVDGTPGEYNIKRITNIEGLTCQGVTKGSAKSGLHGGQSGSWFDAGRNGEGYLVEVIALSDGTLILVIYFFTFDPDGNLAWMVASGVVDGTDSLTMDVFQPMGGVFGPDFDPADIANIDWGSMTFQLGCAGGSLSFDSTQPGYGSAERVLSRITDQLGVSCND